MDTASVNDIVKDSQKWERGWTGGLPETPCGLGSRVSNTVQQRAALARWAREYDIGTVGDIGAGDLNWSRYIDWPPGVRYSAWDLVPRHRDVIEFDLIKEIPPKFDLIMCVWVLNHLTEPDARQALRNLWLSNSRLLVYTWRPKMFDFLDLDPIESVVIWRDKDVELRLVDLRYVPT
jgi:hypothetical protein